MSRRPEPERRSEGTRLPFDMPRQPSDDTCGPTCLHAVYRYFGEHVDLEQLIQDVTSQPAGGTLAAHLGCDALGRGYRATLVTWDISVFDPTWFQPGAEPLADLLDRRRAIIRNPVRRVVCDAYRAFLAAGGEIQFEDLESKLLGRILRNGLPVLTGLSATFLYREERELPDGTPDTIHGDPVGHFVVLTGYSPRTRTIRVNDPMHPNPLAEVHEYEVSISRAVGAIFLGVLTHDANLLILEPREEKSGANPRRRR